jgi:hypothetical protein
MSDAAGAGTWAPGHAGQTAAGKHQVKAVQASSMRTSAIATRHPPVGPVAPGEGPWDHAWLADPVIGHAARMPALPWP